MSGDLDQWIEKAKRCECLTEIEYKALCGKVATKNITTNNNNNNNNNKKNKNNNNNVRLLLRMGLNPHTHIRLTLTLSHINTIGERDFDRGEQHSASE